jgi:hypothetical protein
VLKLNEVSEMVKNEFCVVGGAVFGVTFHGARADDGDFFTYATTVAVQLQFHPDPAAARKLSTNLYDI